MVFQDSAAGVRQIRPHTCTQSRTLRHSSFLTCSPTLTPTVSTTHSYTDALPVRFWLSPLLQHGCQDRLSDLPGLPPPSAGSELFASPWGSQRRWTVRTTVAATAQGRDRAAAAGGPHGLGGAWCPVAAKRGAGGKGVGRSLTLLSVWSSPAALRINAPFTERRPPFFPPTPWTPRACKPL